MPLGRPPPCKCVLLLAQLRGQHGPTLRASTPTCAQAERWSPYTSKRPPQGQRFGARASGRGRRSLPRSMTRYSASGTGCRPSLGGPRRPSSLHRQPVTAAARARDLWVDVVEERLERTLSGAFDAASCQPSLPPGAGHVVRAAGAAASSSSSPCWRKRRATCSAARVLGGVPAAVACSSGRRRAASTPGWCSRSARTVPAHELQSAAWRSRSVELRV